MSEYNDMIGTTRTLFHVGGPSGPKISIGRVEPNGNVAGNPGDLYFDMSDGPGATLWVKEGGSGTMLGWASK